MILQGDSPPWRNIRVNIGAAPPAFLADEERLLCYWLGAHAYSGRGEILDLGAFLGGSASAIAAGLRANTSLSTSEKAARVHCFDVFRFRNYMRNHFNDPIQNNQSFLSRFHDNIAGLEDLLLIHPGSVEERAWRFGPVEVAFIDCAKSFQSNAAIVEKFFHLLLPGAIVVQQDYGITSRLIWLHATMEFFADHFDYIGSMAHGGGGSVVFRLARTISREDADSCVARLKTDTETLAEAAGQRMRHLEREYTAITSSLAKFRSNPLPI